MTISIWRFSHFALALMTSLFLILASVTGAILAFEPISNQFQEFKVSGLENITLSETIENLSQRNEEVFTIQKDGNDFVSASVISSEGESDTFYIHPKSGETLGSLIEKAPIFKFTTNLHRSLFLKSTGRCIVGLVSFFLILMAVSGVVLIAKRQGGIQRFFSKVVNENFEQYYHVVFGRWLLIPLLVVAISGVYLSLEKFSLLPESDSSHNTSTIQQDSFSETKSHHELEIFKTIPIADVQLVEFPFSEDPEDYFFVKLHDKELLIHQYSGKILSEQHYPWMHWASFWSMKLHTGQGSIVWSVVLFVVCLGILFFIYSGFAMSLKRLKTSKRVHNKYDKDDAEYIILVGSETGTTYHFARLFFNALLKLNKKVYLTDLNHYTNFENAKQLVVFTSTYGEGEAPLSANQFENKLRITAQSNPIEYAVLGFGSLLYPDYCKYAILVDSLLQKYDMFTPKLPLHKINNQSETTFKDWIKNWSKANNLELNIEELIAKPKRNKQHEFSVINKTELNLDSTFLIELRPSKLLKFKSGDLLSITVNNDQSPRLYSIGRKQDHILLSIKKHEQGLCSNYLNQLVKGDILNAEIQQNTAFHFPKHKNEVVMIANGTGIAPFLGMINDNKKRKNLHLFWGGRTKASFNLYKDDMDKAISRKHLSSITIAYSKDANHQYVQDLIKERFKFIANHLQNEGVIMICGSIAMQNDVLKTLQSITKSVLNKPLSDFENIGQIKTDCY